LSELSELSEEAGELSEEAGELSENRTRTRDTTTPNKQKGRKEKKNIRRSGGTFVESQATGFGLCQDLTLGWFRGR